MTAHKLDQILAGEEELAPSSGFLAAVMERIEEEAAAPPPIPFPWKRAIPGFALATGVFGWGGFEFFRHGFPALATSSISSPHLSVAIDRPLEQVGWVALALAVSLASWLFSRAVAGRSGLL